MKSFFPPPWQIPGLFDGTIGQVSWPIPRKLTEWQWADGFEGVAWRIPNATVYSNGVWHTWDADGVGGENSREATVEKAKAEALQSAIDQGFIKCHVKPGDVLAGKEAFHMVVRYSGRDLSDPFVVFRDGAQKYRSGLYVSPAQHYSPGAFDELTWKSPVTMPLWASRLHLRVLSVRAQRCVDATEADAMAEGIRPTANCMTIDCDTKDPRERLRALWHPAYARRGLEWENSWRWVAKVEGVNQGKRGNS